MTESKHAAGVDEAMRAGVPASIVRWFAEKSAQAIEALEYEGRLLHPCTIRRTVGPRAKDEPALLRAPSVGDRLKAKVDACKHVATSVSWKGAGTMTSEEAVVAVGREQYDELVTTALVALCVRTVAPPHGQAYTLKSWTEAFPLTTVNAIDAQLWSLVQLENPMLPEALDDAHFLALVQLVAIGGASDPLEGIAGPGRLSFMRRMAVELLSFKTQRSSPPPLETSTPEETPPSSSSS